MLFPRHFLFPSLTLVLISSPVFIQPSLARLFPKKPSDIPPLTEGDVKELQQTITLYREKFGHFKLIKSTWIKKNSDVKVAWEQTAKKVAKVLEGSGEYMTKLAKTVNNCARKDRPLNVKSRKECSNDLRRVVDRLERELKSFYLLRPMLDDVFEYPIEGAIPDSSADNPGFTAPSRLVSLNKVDPTNARMFRKAIPREGILNMNPAIYERLSLDITRYYHHLRVFCLAVDLLNLCEKHQQGDSKLLQKDMDSFTLLPMAPLLSTNEGYKWDTLGSLKRSLQTLLKQSQEQKPNCEVEDVSRVERYVPQIIQPPSLLTESIGYELKKLGGTIKRIASY
ncbi:hypothetical protein BJ684DRAFT_15018 [Piptocephalis cylindrospora]|uniref:Uncharacterized protein n=1 Tax=Piptocephalis cylindrospora TaxID=1907219 RepID=A0A4P9Y778_9FUNG|nr:hypothetical protein BJ684DRAFT_15018 [Piptocephalis cylindrospora]|eukprot:RKP14672.1 hypothetical protein BJ684DRAFT_15018 [Piptocephalis cylindrospora]